MQHFSRNDDKVLKVIERSLALAGEESKSIILNYIQERYNMDLNALSKYRYEFTNYLEEMLGDSAEIISTRINQALEEYQIAERNEREEDVKQRMNIDMMVGGSNNNNVTATTTTIKENNGGSPLCYICNSSVSADTMQHHLMVEHTRDEIARHLAIIYVDDWKEEAELKAENAITMHHLLRN